MVAMWMRRVVYSDGVYDAVTVRGVDAPRGAQPEHPVSGVGARRRCTVSRRGTGYAPSVRGVDAPRGTQRRCAVSMRGPTTYRVLSNRLGGCGKFG